MVKCTLLEEKWDVADNWLSFKRVHTYQ